MTLTVSHLASIVATLAGVTGIGIYAARHVRTAGDFAVGGRRAGPALVAGTIIGTITGGASTIGTAQLAYQVGLSAWWFTLGAGLALLFMGLFLARPLRESGLETIPQFLVRTYGPQAGPLSSVFASVGIFFSLVANILAVIPLVTAVFGAGPAQAAVIVFVFVIGYVFFGGVWGTGLVGLAKLLLLYFSLVIAGVVAYTQSGGLTGLMQAFPPYPWFSLVGRGVFVDLAAALSLLVGTVSTQTYVQAVYAGRDVRAARYGVLLAALLVFPTGLPAVLVGMHMRQQFPGIDAANALPLFVVTYLPPWVGGIILATLLIAALGSVAGLILGISTMLTQDVYKRVLAPQVPDVRVLGLSRLLVALLTVLALVFTFGQLRSLILEWNFLSMGLRGAGVCLPLLAAVFWPDRIGARAGVAALGAGPVAALLWKVWGPAVIDPLYPGLLVCSVVLLSGWQRRTAGGGHGGNQE